MSSYQPREPPEPEPESQNWHERPMGRFFTDEELGEMYRESQDFDPTKGTEWKTK